MNHPLNLTQPLTLEENTLYERREWDPQRESWNITLVRLIAYANCPANVWISDNYGKIIECPRSELYTLPKVLN